MTTTSSRPFRTGAAALGLSLLAGLTACGGSSASAEEVSATLAIISTNIETAAGSGAFEPATEGQSLVVGDKVKTDPTGFAELTYHDGSWQRIEQSATLTIEELTDKGDTDTVKTSIDIGQSWNRVEKLTEPDDAYEVETPVGTAAVRGTQFATNCPTTTECTFKVVDGTVIVTPLTGDPVTLTAGQQTTITASQPPPAATTPGVPALSADPFIAKNLQLDTTKAAESDGGDDEGDEQSAPTNDLEGTWAATVTNVRLGELRGGFAGGGLTMESSGPEVTLTYDRGRVSGTIPFDGEFVVSCSSEGCAVGDSYVIAEDGTSLRVLDRASLETPTGNCGYALPPGAWEVTRTANDTLRFTGVKEFGQLAGCVDAAQVIFDVEMNRVG